MMTAARLLAALGFALSATLLAADAQPLPGQLVIDPDDPRWLKRHGGRHVFICGPGDPEGFLYRGTRQADGTRTGDQLELIDKLIQHGGNCIYLQAVRTHGGDAKPDTTHNPFIDSDPAKGLDDRILAQWEGWFRRMDENGILIYFYFYDDSARVWHTGDTVGPAERTFFETLVRRFKHHRNLIWIFGEESEERYTAARVRAAAEIIRAADPHGHIIGDHHLNGTMFKSWKPGGALTHFAMQMKASTGEEAHAAAVEALRIADRRYQVIYSESTLTPATVEGMRAHAWGAAMGGLMPMMLQMDIASTPVEALQQCRHLQRFFEESDFYTMSPHDELNHGETHYVLADPGRSYIAYADTLRDELGLKALPAGRCEITWLDCVSGATRTEQQRLANKGDRTFRKPTGFGMECAAWIRFPDVARRSPSQHASTSTAAIAGTRRNRAPEIEDRQLATAPGHALYVQLAFADDDGPGPYSYTIIRPPRNGTLTGSDNDRTYTPKPGFTGDDSFTWKTHDGAAESRVGIVNIRVRPPAKQ